MFICNNDRINLLNTTSTKVDYHLQTAQNPASHPLQPSSHPRASRFRPSHSPRTSPFVLSLNPTFSPILPPIHERCPLYSLYVPLQIRLYLPRIHRVGARELRAG